MKESYEPKQNELICGECPLSDCDEDSLWCALSWSRGGNEAQKALVNITVRRAEKRITDKEYNRLYYRLNRERLKEYHREYYQRNREKKLAAANERNRQAKRSRNHQEKGRDTEA